MNYHQYSQIGFKSDGTQTRKCAICGALEHDWQNIYCFGERKSIDGKCPYCGNKMKGGRSPMKAKKGMTKNQKLKLNKTAAAKKKVKATKK